MVASVMNHVIWLTDDEADHASQTTIQ